MNILSLALAISLFAAAPAWGAIAHDATNSTSGLAASSCSFSHTTAAGSDRLGVARIYTINGSPIRTVSSATYNGVALTPLMARDSATDNQSHAAILYLIAPATGANTFSVTFSGSADVYACVFSTYTGVDQVTPAGGTAGADNLGASPITVDVSSAANELVVDVVGFGNAAGHTTGVTLLGVGAGQTQRANIDLSDDSVNVGASDEAGAVATTMSWTYGAEQGSQYWLTVAAGIRPAGAAPSRRPITPMVLQ